MAVSIDQAHGLGPSSRPPRCNRKSLTQLEYKMFNFSKSELAQILRHAFNFVHKSLSTPCLSNPPRVEDDSATNSRIEIIVGHDAPHVQAMVVEVAIAMASGVRPEPVSSGLGGAYFLHARNGDTIAVAKPIDEEPLAFNNPKGCAGRMLGQPGIKSSIRLGETGFRESAAYLLDHDGFAGVPPTGLVKLSHVEFNLNGPDSFSAAPHKIASLQRFVKHDSDAGDLGPSSFSATCVHHIGILDIRLMNLDRHAGNILVRLGKESYGGGKAELVPIDHGFCLPEALDDPYFEWLHWPQASMPFSEMEVDYISSLDPYKDAELIRTELPAIRESSIRVLVLCAIFLKRATAYGLCLAHIGEMMTREFRGGEENWSSMEKLCLIAKAHLNNRPSGGDVDTGMDEMLYLHDEHDVDDLKKAPRDTYIRQNSPTKGRLSNIPRFDPKLYLMNKKKPYPIDECDLNTMLDHNPKAGGLTSPATDYDHGGRQNISFGDMDDEEWQSFLKTFEKLLLKALEERKFKHRL